MTNIHTAMKGFTSAYRLSTLRQNLFIAMIIIFAFPSLANNQVATTTSDQKQQPLDMQIIYPESITSLSKHLLELELQEGQKVQSPSCNNPIQDSFSVKNTINMLDFNQATQGNTEIPKELLSQFSGSIFFSNSQIDDLISTENSNQKP